MAKLLYSAIMSLDGYIADQNGNFDWSMPDEEVHSFVNDVEDRIGTYLLGRRMYEVMVFWETVPAGGNIPAGRTRVRRVVAAEGQSGLFPDLGKGLQRPHPDRAGV